MLYDPYEILELLVRGGFLAVAGIPAVRGRVSFSVCRSDRAQLFQSLRVRDNRALEKG